MTDKEIKERVRNISDTVKITRAMQMIATTKIYSNQNRKENAFNYLGDATKAAAIAMNYADPSDKWFTSKNNERSAYIVITGDKGMCGDYNNRVLTYADNLLAKSQGKPKIFVIGYVGREYYKGKPYSLVGTYIHHQLNPTISESAKMADELIDLFFKDNFKDLYIVYTEVFGLGETKPVHKKLLPMEYMPSGRDELFLGNKQADIFLREKLISELFYAVASASLGVNYSRMVAMRQATLNGEAMVEDLQLQYNKTRQEKITNELNDAVAVKFGKRR